MAKYMTQKMSSGTLVAITYYRKQKNDHVNHDESRAFTTNAKDDYAETRSIAKDQVELGKFMSNQGVPTGGETKEI